MWIPPAWRRLHHQPFVLKIFDVTGLIALVGLMLASEPFSKTNSSIRTLCVTMSHRTPPPIPPPLPLPDNRAPLVPPRYSSMESQQPQPSLDITQKLERNLANLNASDNVFKRWIYEIVSWSVSALSMAAVVGMLVYCNNKALTKSSLYLTAISVFSKLASAALILPTSEALGQLKWNWFHGKKSKEIWDFEIFDKASRGPWGSIMLLLRTKGRSLAALGAILTVLLLANDTFFQRVVNLPERWALQGKGLIAKVVRYDPELMVELRGGRPQAQQDLVVRPTLLQYYYRNGTQPIAMEKGFRPEIPLSCPTNNCTFPAFDTLGVCSQCTDISDMLEFDCRPARLDWLSDLKRDSNRVDEEPFINGTACGYFLNSTTESATLVSGYIIETSNGTKMPGEALLLRMMPLTTGLVRHQFWEGSIHFKDTRNPILDTLIISSENGSSGVYRNETPIAQECVLSWCVKRMKTSVFSAALQEVVTAVFTNSTRGPFPWKIERIVKPAPDHDTFDVDYKEEVIVRVNTSSGSLDYGLSTEHAQRIISNFDDIFPSYVTVANSTANSNWRYKTYAAGEPYYRPVKRNPWLYPNNLTTYMDRMATSMTNIIRSTSGYEMVEGPAYATETYVNVQWAWLTFPFLLLILSLVFLVATIRKTATGPGVWKTSAMPTLIYSLPKDMQKEFTPPSPQKSGSFSSSSGKPKNIRIRIDPKKGWRVSGRPVSPGSPVIVLRSNQPPPGWI